MMMPTSVTGTCRETAQNIGDYLDGRMPLFRRLRIRIHLNMCPLCKKWFKSLVSTLKGVDRAVLVERAIEVPPELRAKIERIFQT